MNDMIGDRKKKPTGGGDPWIKPDTGGGPVDDRWKRRINKIWWPK